MIKTGPKNLITDVPGILIGNVQHERIRTGVTVIQPEFPATTAVDVRGGGPGSRETEALNPDCLLDAIHAVVLSGGSAFGLDAAGGVMAYLSERKIGFEIAGAIVPVVPSAILFDLANGGDKAWGNRSPYFELGYQAAGQVSKEFKLGNAGAGYGARAAELKGGLGSASLVFTDGDSEITVGAIAAVNSMGSVTMPESPTMWAYAFERDNELGGQPSPKLEGEMALDYPFIVPVGKNTTLVAVATNAKLTKPQAKRVAMMAQDGLARAIRPVHSPFDGDSVFAMSTGRVDMADPVVTVSRLGMLAADCAARAIARGVYEAESIGDMESYRSRYGDFLRSA